MNPIRWLIAGAGQISRSFATDIREAGGEVSAVWARRAEAAEAFADEFDVPAHSHELGALLIREDVDAVYVATPPASHVEVALRAVEAGKHVLVEKPIATNAADAERIFARAAERGVFAMEAMWMKFNPLHREVMRLIDEGLLGEVRSVRGGFGMPFPAGGNRWSAAAGGSTVLDQGIYPVTLASWALGDATGVHATGSVLDGVDVRASIATAHGADRTAQSTCSILEFADPSASISGTAGWIEIPAMFWAGDRALVHAGSADALFHSPTEVVRPREGNGYVPMIREVQGAIADGLLEHWWHTGAASLAVMRTLDEVRRQIHDA